MQPPPEKTRVVFIGGYGRSGSTLLDRLLGNIEGFESVGELRYLWEWGIQQNLLCACGTPIRKCSFWSRVLRSTLGQIDDIDVVKLLETKATIEQVVRPKSLLFPSQILGGDQPLRDEYGRLIARLYQAIAHHANCKTIVDSSKHPSRAALLAGLDDIDLYIVHLVRDCRAVAYSWQRKRVRLEVQEKTALMDVHGTFRCIAHWLGHNRLIASLKDKAAGYLTVRYEDLVSSPEKSLGRILEWLGQPDADLNFLCGQQAVFAASHTVAGNPMRFQTGAISVKLDDEWKRQFAFTKRLAVSGCTWPMLLRYGYPLWG